MPNEGVEKSHESKNGKIRGLKTVAPLEIVAYSAYDEAEILVELFNSLFSTASMTCLRGGLPRNGAELQAV